MLYSCRHFFALISLLEANVNLLPRASGAPRVRQSGFKRAPADTSGRDSGYSAGGDCMGGVVKEKRFGHKTASAICLRHVGAAGSRGCCSR